MRLCFPASLLVPWLAVSLVFPACSGDEGSDEADPRPAAAPVRTAAADAPHIVVVVCDTLRADHLDLYGYERPTAPRLAAWADDALVFDQATAPSNWTRASIYALFTGRYPLAGRKLTERNKLPVHEPRLAELVRLAGYDTIGVSANPYISDAFRANLGFRVLVDLDWNQHLKQPGHWKAACSAPAVLEQVEQQLEARPADGKPVFLYVQFMDTHAPHDPPADSRPWSDAAYAGPFDGTRPAYEGLHDRSTDDPLPPPDQAQLEALYDGSILALDDGLERLRALVAEHLDDRPVLTVVTADHGEGLGDGPDGSYLHKRGLHQGLTHIPLVVDGLEAQARRLLPASAADDVPGRGRVGERVSLIDLMPTLLRVAGAERPQDIDGLDLFDPASRRPGRDVVAYRAAWEKHEATRNDQLAVLRDGWRAEWRPEGWRLFVHATGEELTAQQPDVLASLVQAADRWRDTSATRRREREKDEPDELEDAELSAEDDATLDALGYIGGNR